MTEKRQHKFSTPNHMKDSRNTINTKQSINSIQSMLAFGNNQKNDQAF
jgi:hypothetical protein